MPGPRNSKKRSLRQQIASSVVNATERFSTERVAIMKAHQLKRRQTVLKLHKPTAIRPQKRKPRSPLEERLALALISKHSKNSEAKEPATRAPQKPTAPLCCDPAAGSPSTEPESVCSNDHPRTFTWASSHVSEFLFHTQEPQATTAGPAVLLFSSQGRRAEDIFPQLECFGDQQGEHSSSQSTSAMHEDAHDFDLILLDDEPDQSSKAQHPFVFDENDDDCIIIED